MISLSPTANCCNFITDLSNEAFNKMHTPKSACFQTRAVFICEQPVLGSLISDKSMELIQQLETLDKHDTYIHTYIHKLYLFSNLRVAKIES